MPRKKVEHPQPTPEPMQSLHRAILAVQGRVDTLNAATTTTLGMIFRDLQFVVRTVRDIDNRTKEMRSVQYAPPPAPLPEPSNYAEGAKAFEAHEANKRQTGYDTGAAPLCYKCGLHRDANVHLRRDSIHFHEYQVDHQTGNAKKLAMLDGLLQRLTATVSNHIANLEQRQDVQKRRLDELEERINAQKDINSAHALSITNCEKRLDAQNLILSAALELPNLGITLEARKPPKLAMPDGLLQRAAEFAAKVDKKS